MLNFLTMVFGTAAVCLALMTAIGGEKDDAILLLIAVAVAVACGIGANYI